MTGAGVPPDVLIDGRATRQIDVADRGLQYGDGLFETIACIGGRPRWLARHLARLRLGCARLGIGFDEFDALRREIQCLAARGPRCLVKVIVTRGVAAARGYRPCGNERPTRIVRWHDWPPAPPPAGLRLGISTVRLGDTPRLAGLKHLNRLEQVLAQQELSGAGADAPDELLMLDARGQVISATSANVFLLGAQNRLVTPALEHCGVAGIVRGLILESGAAAAGLAVEVRAMAAAELVRARAVFVSNVRLGVHTVRWFDGQGLPTDPRIQRLKDWVDATMD